MNAARRLARILLVLGTVILMLSGSWPWCLSARAPATAKPAAVAAPMHRSCCKGVCHCRAMSCHLGMTRCACCVTALPKAVLPAQARDSVRALPSVSSTPYPMFAADLAVASAYVAACESASVALFSPPPELS